MTTIAPDDAADQINVAAGVDTHQDTHTAAVVDTAGRLLGHRVFPATGAGYVALLAWLRTFGVLLVVGIEGTGAYGAGLARHLRTQDVAMLEIDRPDRKTRRSAGKSDPIDAEAGRGEALRNLPHAPPWPRSRPESRRRVRVGSKRCATCGWPAAARWTNAATACARSRP